MGLKKRVCATTVGCHASEADPVKRGENLLLRLSAPFFVCVRFLRDPDAGNTHGFLAVGVVLLSLNFIPLAMSEPQGRSVRVLAGPDACERGGDFTQPLSARSTVLLQNPLPQKF